METQGKIQVGEIVLSKAGHDKGELFLVKEIVGEYALICDGKTRKASKPKKKKIKHLFKTGQVCNWVAEQPCRVNNTSVKKAIREMIKKEEV